MRRALITQFILEARSQLNEGEAAFIDRLRKGQLSGDDLKTRPTSRALIVATGTLLFAPPEITRRLEPLE